MLVHRREIVEQLSACSRSASIARPSIGWPRRQRRAPSPNRPVPVGDGNDVGRLEAALEQRPRDPGLLVQLAELHLRDRDAEGATAAIERLAAVDPAHAKLRDAARAAGVDRHRARSPPIRSPLREALAANPRDSAARHALAAHHALAGDFATALAEWLELMRTRPLVRRRRGTARHWCWPSTCSATDHELVAAYRRRMANLLH